LVGNRVAIGLDDLSESALECLWAKAELAKRLNVEVFICGN
jgi:hypothetical protein